ncbi:MAG TPA: sugar phosphate isomerase/epimerase [Sumerlaeia bacterium]|nr:sugar phosphate isomerase/epimerase [Sumerlaeia bacterium]
MGEKTNQLTVFSKPWPDKPLPELAKFVKGLGLDGVELPVRPGYQVEPKNVTKGLPEAAKILADHGLKIGSVAGPTDEATIAACGKAGVPIIRICVGIDMNIGYFATEEKVRKEFDALIPALDRHGVSIGVQNHCDVCVGSAVGIMHLIEKYDPKHVSAVLDPAHSAVDGEPEAMGLDIVWSHLSLINFKAAFHLRTNGPEAPEAEWTVHWTTGRHSGFSWSKMVNLLKQRGYKGDICLPAEYSRAAGGQYMGEDTVPLLVQDIAYIKCLLAQKSGEVKAQWTDWQSAGPK